MEQKWTFGLWGAVLGAVACAIVGLTWGGWETRSSAQVLAQRQVNAALVKALTPICVANFQTASDAPAKLVELKKISSTWSRETFVKEGKWAEIGKEQNGQVVDACAEALYKL
jgi:hypothetical protein